MFVAKLGDGHEKGQRKEKLQTIVPGPGSEKMVMRSFVEQTLAYGELETTDQPDRCEIDQEIMASEA
jgi:hypothetical protein